MSRIYPAMAAASAANMSSIRASVDEAHAASQQLARDAIKKAYRDEAAGVRR
jgi:tetrahydromethanopterin S-methyltransferase subunit F